MKCIVCGCETMNEARENMPLVGLRRVTLVEVQVWRCADCGEFEVEIPHHSALVDLVTRALLNKSGRLDSTEIRWLRSVMGFSGVELARHMGVSPESVSKWENGKMSPRRTADRLIRLLVAHKWPSEQYPHQAMTLVASDDNAPLVLRLKHEDQGWCFDGPVPETLIADPTQKTWTATHTASLGVF
jgi:putative zinc finger/helix-turn-helix YgiT family protein